MTEAEWFACTDPRPMLEFLKGGVTSALRSRLFVLACCRRVWDDGGGAAAVAIRAAERYATGPIGKMRREVVKVSGGQVKLDCTVTEPLGSLEVWGAGGVVTEITPDALDPVLVGAIDLLACHQCVISGVNLWLAHRLDQAGLALAIQADLYRDIVRAPFRPLMFQAGWRTCHDSAVLRVAQQIDRDEVFVQLPYLADALMDAGCDNDELLAHLQSPVEHVRGCWALDLVLGRF